MYRLSGGIDISDEPINLISDTLSIAYIKVRGTPAPFTLKVAAPKASKAKKTVVKIPKPTIIEDENILIAVVNAFRLTRQLEEMHKKKPLEFITDSISVIGMSTP